MKISFSFILIFLIISHFAEAATFTVSLKKPNHSIVLKKKKEIATYTPNSSFHLSAKLIAKNFFFQYGFKIPNTNFGRSNVGNDSYKDLRLGVYFGNGMLEGFYKRYIGFSSTESGGKAGCNSCLIRNGLSSEESLLQYIYAWKPGFSLRNIISGAANKVEKEISFILNIYANRLKIKDGENVVQGTFVTNHTEYKELKRFDLHQIGFGPGFAINLPIFWGLYFGGLTSASIGFQKNKMIFNSDEQIIRDIGFNYNLRLLVGTHHEKYNFGIKADLVTNIYKIENNSQIASVNYEARLYSSINF